MPSHEKQKGLEEKECVFKSLNSCVKEAVICGIQLFAKAPGPCVYLTLPPPFELLREFILVSVSPADLQDV